MSPRMIPANPVPIPTVTGVDEGPATATTPCGRASWSGLLQCSLVTIPVKAYPATVSGREIHFHQLHAGCGQRLRQEKHCPRHGKVEAGALVSGYAYAPEQYLVVEATELDQLRPAKEKALSLERFLEAGSLDPGLFAGRGLYLLPEGPAAHLPYVLLAQAMEQKGKWALGRMVLSGHRHLALVRPASRVLAVHLLHFPAHLRSSRALEAELRQVPLGEAERQLAGQLVDAASQPIVWSEYRDDYEERLTALVEARLHGRPLEAPVEETTPVVSLLEALKQSVAQALGQEAQPVTPAPAGRRERKKASRRSA